MTAFYALIGAVLVSALLIFISIFSFKLVRKKTKKRSPLQGKKLANLPGQQLMKRISDHGDDMLGSLSVMYFSMPMVLGTWALIQVDWNHFSFGINEAFFIVIALAVFGLGLALFIKHAKARYQAEDGLIAEQMTGQLLNRLIGPSCIVTHDVPCDGFNIDHVVIAPRAVYAVETKSFRKRHSSDDDSHYKVTYDGRTLQFNGWHNSEAVEQARRQARWLARYLRDSLDREIPVIPALSLPGWWIDTTESGRSSDVKVFTPMGRGAQFLLGGSETLDASTRALIAQAIAQKYPNVEA